jgi:UDP-glucose 4-epimerase
MTTVVITGGAGFLGRALTACLVSNGLDVIPVSRRSIPGICQVQDYRDSPAGDILIHVAEEPDRGIVNRGGETYKQHAYDTIKSLASRFKQRVIYASSGVVYGDAHENPCKVDMPVVAADLYSKSKLLNEQTVLDSGGAVVRLSNLLGDGMSVNNVVSDIIRQIPGTGLLRVRDDMPVRDYLPVAEAARGIGLLVKVKYSGIVNVGSGVGISVRALAELALSSVEQEDREIIATDPAFRRSINILDISEMKALCNWTPAFSLKEQLAILIRNKAKSANE